MTEHSGKYLKIDLSRREITEEPYDDTFARLYLGGNGFAAKLIIDNVPADVNPLDPENVIVFSVGPLTDTPVWGTSRGHVASISRLTGFFADLNSMIVWFCNVIVRSALFKANHVEGNAFV